MATGESLVEVRAEKSRPLKSSFVVALCLFALMNGCLSFFEPVTFDLFKYPYKGWAWWMMNDLRKTQDTHNVALLGSSVMLSAIASCDANYVNACLDQACYHRAVYLDHKLRTRFGGSFSTFNLSVPGQMPSDAYLALRTMVSTAHRPDVVIYGVFPRDFIDSTLSSPADTEPFKYLRRFVTLDDVYAAVFRSPFTKLEWWLGRVVYLYGYSLDLQMAFVELADKFLATYVPQPFNNPRFTWWDRVRLLPAYLPGEVHASAVMAVPTTREEAARQWRDNTLEYQQRYKSPDAHVYRTQLNFLKQIARFCQKERIELIVVNMPVTAYHIGMLKPGIYTRYVQAMKEEAIRGRYTFYDLCDIGRYEQIDYTDPVHLNAFGGKKFIDHLVEMLAIDRRAASALVMAGQQLERHQALAASGKDRTY